MCVIFFGGSEEFLCFWFNFRHLFNFRYVLQLPYSVLMIISAILHDVLRVPG